MQITGAGRVSLIDKTCTLSTLMLEEGCVVRNCVHARAPRFFRVFSIRHREASSRGVRRFARLIDMLTKRSNFKTAPKDERPAHSAIRFALMNRRSCQAPRRFLYSWRLPCPAVEFSIEPPPMIQPITHFTADAAPVKTAA